ncbi:MAG: Breakpoint cluster region protein [Gammaproteobacteria bacterium]|nr:Breakpoint cluster region protein [Gammaproteobacteria bacterium]
MSGALLRSGALREFFALGAVGHPVYQSATQLRVAMRSQIGADVADTFAVPKRNDSGDTIDWYAPYDGPVVPWTAATDDERAQALQSLQAMRERVLSAGQRLQAESDSERQVFGRLLQHVMTFPDDQHVYLVDGKPVLTFWGFRRHDAPSTVDSLALLALPRAAAPAAAAAVPVVETAVRGRRWPWWLWPLLLLLLLLPLLFWYRSCSEVPTLALPSAGVPELPRGDLQPELRERPVYDAQGRPVDVLPGRDGVTLPDGGAVPVDDAPVTEPPVADETPAPVEEAETPPPTEPPAPEIEPPPAEEPPPEPPQPPTPEEPPLPPELPPGTEQPLQIPPQALQNGNVDFLNGRWNSNSGLIDESGRPVQLEYEFQDGKGTVSLRRSDGSVCRGNTSASISQQRLMISDRTRIKCPDGQQFEPSTVDCAVGSSGQAECNGRYASGGDFPVEIRQADQPSGSE